MQLLGPFGFFALALAGILWLAQTLPLIEIIIDNGRSGFIFVEFSLLILPNVLVIVLPIAAFAATIFTINRMFSESEMVVVMSAGLSPLQIARPIAIFGTLVLAAMFIVIIYLQPLSITRLGNQIAQLRQDAAATLIKDRQFIHPSKGITIFVRESSRVGEMLGLFLNDDRDPLNPVTYSADQALMLQDDQELRLVMSNGVMQRFSVEDNTLAIIDFEQLVFDLTEFVNRPLSRNRTPLEYRVGELLHPDDIIANGGDRSFGVYFAEGHNKISLPFLGLALPLLAVSIILSARYRRTGFGYRITFIVLLGAVVVTVSLMSKSWIAEKPSTYLLSYVPAILVFILSAILLTYRTYRGGRITRVEADAL